MFSLVFAGRTVATDSVMRALHAVAVVLVTVFALAPAPVSAATVEQIVALSKAGVSEAVILALLDRDRTLLTIEPDQLVALKRDGLSDAIITAMLKSGRDQAEDAARAVSEANAASVLSALNSTPGLVVVGHGPDRPNTVHTEDLYRGFRDGVRLPSAIPYSSPYAIPHAAPYRRGFATRGFQSPPHLAPMLCLAQVNTAKGRGPAYVTECPAVMQRSLRTR